MIAVGQRAVIAEGAYSTVGGERIPVPEWVGLAVTVSGLEGLHDDGDIAVATDTGTVLWVAAACLRVPFDAIPAAVANDAVRAVENAWYAGGANGIGQLLPNGTEGPESIRALLALGWTPPAVTT